MNPGLPIKIAVGAGFLDGTPHRVSDYVGFGVGAVDSSNTNVGVDGNTIRLLAKVSECKLKVL
jgi:hypothetical protein